MKNLLCKANFLTQWYYDLQSLDSLDNHKVTINDIWESFLESEYADDRETRLRAYVFIRHLRKIVK